VQIEGIIILPAGFGGIFFPWLPFRTSGCCRSDDDDDDDSMLLNIVAIYSMLLNIVYRQKIQLFNRENTIWR
jgi:hypothetical protein